jgi:hypothetical protein
MVNNELEMIWKEVAMAELTYYPDSCLDGENFNQDRLYPSADSKRVPLGHVTACGMERGGGKAQRILKGWH